MKLIIFKLKFLTHNKIHFIFYAALLKLASDNIFKAKIMNIKKYENQNYKIKK